MRDFLCIDDIRFCYPNRPKQHQCNLDNITFSLKQSEIGAIIGPSGCGKSTLLQIIAGFLLPSKGQVSLSKKTLTTTASLVEPNKRGIGMVFQDYALFPHLSVGKNVAFGMKKKDTARVSELLATVGLSGYEHKMPHEISGGEQQRVAIARAIASDPQVLLMDEPFSGLDANLREQLVRDLKTWFKQMAMTAIIVTHDQREAFAIADHIGVMLDGKLVQWSPPYQLYHQPESPFVANFVGQGRMLPAKAIDTHNLASALGDIHSTNPLDVTAGEEVFVFLRPEDIVYRAPEQTEQHAVVRKKFFHGASTLYELSVGDTRFVANFNSHSNFAPDDTIGYALEALHIVIFKG